MGSPSSPGALLFDIVFSAFSYSVGVIGASKKSAWSVESEGSVMLSRKLSISIEFISLLLLYKAE